MNIPKFKNNDKVIIRSAPDIFDIGLRGMVVVVSNKCDKIQELTVKLGTGKTIHTDNCSVVKCPEKVVKRNTTKLRKFLVIAGGEVKRTIYRANVWNAKRTGKIVAKKSGVDDFILWDVLSGIVYVHTTEGAKITKRKDVKTTEVFIQIFGETKGIQNL